MARSLLALLMFFPPSSNEFQYPFPFAFFLFSFRLPVCVSSRCSRGETYASKAEVSFLLSLVSSPSAAQTTAKDLWPSGLSPEAETEIQPAMADREPGLLQRCLYAAKSKIRNAR